jgi:radical SAM protein with 4Fe4S-binding SPASM domain
MRLWLSGHNALKRLENPCVYDIRADELYELDDEGFSFLLASSSPEGAESQAGEFTDFCIDEGILTTREVSVRRPSVENSPLPSLRYLELQITRRCNLNCAHCYIGSRQDDELSPESIESVLAELERMQGLRLLLTGGEPLLHREFKAINRMLPDFALRTVLFTNGHLLTDKILRSLNVNEIQISIDGLEEGHDTLRGKGSYRIAMDAIKRAIGREFEVSVSTMVHPGNLNDFDRMQEMFRNMGVRDWTVDVPCVEGNLRDHPEHRLEPVAAGKYLSYGFGGSLHEGGPGYACGRHLMSVMSDGSAAKCAFYADNPVGNIKEGIVQCWRRVTHYRLDELECDCQFIDECRGGCRYRARALGSETGKDLYRCGLYDKI